MIASPWAILLCKFSDDDSEPFARDFYEDLFTRSGAGTQNMVDFFADASHGALDLGGSRVLGWYTLDQKRSDYVGSGANQQGRNDLVDWARAKAVAENVDLSAFVGVVVCMNVATDLFGGGGRVVCDNTNMQPSLLGQEMGHGYGLSHSRIDGSTADYMDPWDIMSTASPYEAVHQRYTRVGPFLNAANADSKGWLDPARVYTAGAGYTDTTITLRPLTRRDLPGFLVARLGPYYIEFRVRERWDAGIRWPCVMIHYFEDGHSYLVPGAGGVADITKGGYFEKGSNNALSFESWFRIEVMEMDAAGHSATIRLAHRPAQRPPAVGPGHVFGGVGVDGGGWIWIGGKLHRVPPHTPLYGVLNQIAAIEGSTVIANAATRDVVRREAFAEIGRLAGTEQAKYGAYRSPGRLAPRQPSGR